ncbi:MAG: 30S ribosomal protein S4 [Mycoplasmataceae bacterium]|jgi:small subunit ribosomal protein S4|nr:30S ribosomal protein S4 [Mycoplasmataceae bacterium]
MSRYTGSINRKARRLGFSILENNKEFSKGKKRTYAPGQHGMANRKLSGYGEQLAEKQKIALMYGMNDRQFRRLFTIAKKMKGSTALNLLIVLESRLDNLVYRMGFAPTRRSARQLVTHGHIMLNGKKCDIASTIVTTGSNISIKEKSRKIPLANPESVVGTLAFVQVDSKDKTGKYVRFPERQELNQEINETYVVEWYNRLVK